MPRISSVEDLGQLNKALQKIDKLEKKLLQTQDNLLRVTKRVATMDALHAPTPTTNDLVLTWNGPGGSLAWPQASIRDKNAGALVAVSGAQHTVPVTAGTLTGLSPSTHYWIGWSRSQNQLVASTDAHPLLNQQDIHIVCRVFTGTAGQSGVAGGGGSSAVRDISGLTYKNF